MQFLFFPVWLIILSIVPSRSIHVVANGKTQNFILFFVFNGSIVFHFIDTHTQTHPTYSLVLSPFI